MEIADYKRQWYLKNKDSVLKARKVYYSANKDRLLKGIKAYAANNREKILARQAEWYKRNFTRIRTKNLSRYVLMREELLARNLAWKKANPGKVNALEAIRRAAKAFPKWLSQDDQELVKLIYKFCPPGCHVDHIIPLKHKDVNGLHVPWNLQYLPAQVNLKKGNSFKGE